MAACQIPAEYRSTRRAVDDQPIPDANRFATFGRHETPAGDRLDLTFGVGHTRKGSREKMAMVLPLIPVNRPCHQSMGDLPARSVRRHGEIMNDDASAAGRQGETAVLQSQRLFPEEDATPSLKHGDIGLVVVG